MEKALVRILTPKRDVNILRDVAKAKAQGESPAVPGGIHF